MEVYRAGLDMARWQQLIDASCGGEFSEPIVNVDRSRGSHFDAIFLGGGSAGRFGAAVLRSLGARALVLERWPFLAGSCPHQACVPHHLFSEAARELDQAQALAGRLWYGKVDPQDASVLELVELFRSQRTGPHAHMNCQSCEQLGIEFIVNAEAATVDAHTVTAADQAFTAGALVLCAGSRAARPGIPGEDLPGMFDYASFIEDLDYEPARIVVFGGSKVAVEYASFYRATGTPTAVVSRGQLLTTGGPGRMDDDLRRSSSAECGSATSNCSSTARSPGSPAGTGSRRWKSPPLAGHTGSRPTSCCSRPASSPTWRASQAHSQWTATPTASSPSTAGCGPASRMSTRPGTCSARRWRCSSPAAAARPGRGTSWA